ncbi:hypothetical protein SAMN05880557_112107 [Pseudacidovorax sp. RU35E]|nr:hypothetical protein SAMN05880557_112107 [Pseudacidovorax sp. RU35E]
MAELLCLDENLIAFILAQELLPNGWVDEHSRVTPAGQDLLSGGLDGKGMVTLQYAFRDGVFGQWLPRVSQDLPDIRPADSETPGRFPAFRESRDEGREVRPFVLPRRCKVLEPRKADVLKAWQEGLRDALRAGGDDESIPEIQSEDLEIVGGEPSLAYVWCELIHEPDDVHPWLVTDPWRITPVARWLREPLQAGLHDFRGLEQVIQSLVPAADESALTAQALGARIQRDVEAQLSVWSALAHSDLVLLREHLSRVLRQQARVGATPRPTQEELGSLIQECGSLLEALVQWMLVRWPMRSVELSRDGPSRDAAEQILGQLPLRAALPPEARRMLAGQTFRGIRLAAERRDRAFKALLFACLLATHGHEDHPLRELNDAQAQWDRLLTLIDTRNKGTHASGQRLTSEAALAASEFAVAWTMTFYEKF